MNLTKQNSHLKQISEQLFGPDAELMVVKPGELTLLKQNARYFKKDKFHQLVENVKADRRLSSTPLCCKRDQDLIVLSGNHRVKAAIQAGIKNILVLVITADLPRSKQISIQLSPNALAGEDDSAILSDLWTQLEELQDRLYAGLSSDDMGELEKIELVTFTTPQVYTKPVTFAFTAPEKENIDQILTELSKQSGEIYLADIALFTDFFTALQSVKKSEKIKNASLAMLALLKRFNADQEGD